MKKSDVLPSRYWDGGTIDGKSVDLSKIPPSKWSYVAPFSIRTLDCCGIREITSITGITEKYSKQRFLEYLEWILLGYSGYGSSGNGRKNPTTGILLATISHTQPGKKEYEKWLFEMGFEEAKLEWLNHNTGNTVRMFIYRVPVDLWKHKWEPPPSPALTASIAATT